MAQFTFGANDHVYRCDHSDCTLPAMRLHDGDNVYVVNGLCALHSHLSLKG